MKNFISLVPVKSVLGSSVLYYCGALIPKLLNNPFTCSFINLDFLLTHTADFDDNIGLPFFVLNTFESTFSVSFLHFKQYVNMFYND